MFNIGQRRYSHKLKIKYIKIKRPFISLKNE